MLTIGSDSITKRLTWMNLLVSGVALLLACLGFVTYGVTSFRETMVLTLSTQAEIIGSNSVSAILFNDRQSAESTLSALAAAPNILSAGIYTPDGRPFAVYSRTRGAAILALPSLPPGQNESHTFENGRIVLVRLIAFQGKTRGVVCLESDLQEMNRRLGRYAAIAGVVLLTSMLAALLISTIVRRSIAEPIVRLAKVARLVSQERVYSVRATPSANRDEVATLIEAFNEMLAQIQERDTALQSAQERLNLALRSSGVGTWSWDVVQDSFTWDDYLHPLFGLAPGTFPGTYQAFLQLVHSEDRERVTQEVNASVGRDAPYDTRFRVLWTDGSIHDLSSRGKVYRDENGKPVRMSGVCWDITEHRQAEKEVLRLNTELEQRVKDRTAELETTNKELEAFTYSVAHDLRAPLRHVQGFSKALMEDLGPKADASTGEYLRDIIESTQHMGNLIDDLLSLARVGRQDLRVEVTSLDTLVREILRDLQRESNGREIRWQVGDLPFVECDPRLMKQVLYNLISNAVKYTRPRNPAVIELGQIPANGHPVVFVRDNGVGFSMNHADKLFGVFQRLHRREDFEGTGVGLAIVQRIIHKHGGRIWAEAAVDKGAAFFFNLGSSQTSTG